MGAIESSVVNRVESETPADDTALLMTAAFERVKGKAVALPSDEVLDIRVPVGDMVQTIVGALSQLRAHRADLERVGDVDMAHLDNLEDYTYALAYVYSRVRDASGKPSIKTIEQLVATRQLLNAHASALAYSGIFDKDKVARLNRGKSYQDLAYDVVGITNLFLESWSKLERSTILTRSQLVQAQTSATALIRNPGGAGAQAGRTR